VRASVHVEYDLGTSEDTQETYDPKTPAPLTLEHSEESSTGSAPVGVPGTASNVPSGNQPASPAPAGEQSTSRSDATTYAISKVMHHSVQPPGRVRRIAAAVLIDDAIEVTDQGGKRVSTRRKRTADELKQIEQLAQAALGFEAQRGDVLAVENLSFQESPGEIIPAPTKVEHVLHIIQPWSWTLRYLGVAALFLVVYWLVLRPVRKQALAAFRDLPGKVVVQLTPQAAGGPSGMQLPTPEGRAKQLKQTLSDRVKTEPESASRLVQTWVQNEGGK
jgi:flagellar M-ring protein FliF